VRGEARDKVTKRRGIGRGPLARRVGSLDICVGAHEFLDTPLLMRPVYRLIQGRLEEPDR